jgi:hypothetical protein
MKLKAVLLTTLLFSTTPSLAQQRIYEEAYCYENTEEYVPGRYDEYGRYVSGYVKTDRRKVACNRTVERYSQPTKEPRKCTATRTTLGGLLGGGAAAALSKKDAYGWSIPLGAVLGMGVAQAGCE